MKSYLRRVEIKFIQLNKQIHNLCFDFISDVDIECTRSSSYFPCCFKDKPWFPTNVPLNSLIFFPGTNQTFDWLYILNQNTITQEWISCISLNNIALDHNSWLASKKRWVKQLKKERGWKIALCKIEVR